MPDDRKRYIKDSISHVLATFKISNKQLTSTVGMLMSTSAAVYMAPLYIRKLYHAMGHDMRAANDMALAKEDLR